MPVHVDGQDFYTTQEACAVMGIKPATLYAYVSRGVLTSYRQGIKRRRLYRKDEVDGLLALGRGARPASAGEGPQIPLAETWIGYT